MGPVAALLPDGKRLHLQHGPIDLVIGAEGQRDRAFEAAESRFATILSELAAELPLLRTPLVPNCAPPQCAVGIRMHKACEAYVGECFVTRMAAVAGSVADEVLAAMTQAADLNRAYVNNGGDIALHLARGASFRTAMQGHDGRPLGLIEIPHCSRIRGIATSGRHGRSHSLGIADSVTVLASNAATADVGATLIANAVDLPGHPGIARRPASSLQEDSDLGDRLVVTRCATLTVEECRKALARGLSRANEYETYGRIVAASLHLQGETMATEAAALPKEPAHA